MKFSVNKTTFQQAVSRAERIAGKNLSLPSLQCVLVVAEEKEIVLRATNLELGLEVRVSASVEEKGEVAIPVSTLSSFLSATPHADRLTVASEDGHVLMTTPKTTTRIPTYSTEDFPALPVPPVNELFSMKGTELANALRSVSWAASPSSIKPELSSVYLFAEGDELVCVATDSFRLAEKRSPLKASNAFEPILIPVKNVAEIIRHVEDIEGPVVMQGDGNQIGILVDGAHLSSRIIDGVFPDYQQIIPKEFTLTASFLRQDMLDALKQSRIFSDQFNKVVANFDADEKTLSLKTVNATTGESVVVLEGEMEGESLELSFNYTYWADPLQSTKADKIAVECAGVGKPARIRSAGDHSFNYIVMPMNR